MDQPFCRLEEHPIAGECVGQRPGIPGRLDGAESELDGTAEVAAGEFRIVFLQSQESEVEVGFEEVGALGEQPHQFVAGHVGFARFHHCLYLFNILLPPPRTPRVDELVEGSGGQRHSGNSARDGCCPTGREIVLGGIEFCTTARRRDEEGDAQSLVGGCALCRPTSRRIAFSGAGGGGAAPAARRLSRSGRSLAGAGRVVRCGHGGAGESKGTGYALAHRGTLPHRRFRGAIGWNGTKTCWQGVMAKVALRSSPDGPLPASLLAGRADVTRELLAWYDRVGRDLPWRRGRDPYRTWVSEVMLQQTQVERVVGYFQRFLGQFPTVADLAAASEADVLHAWEGLGYYRRARQLQAAARRIVTDHDGRLPASIDALRALPGIGRYTAGAILSIAFDQPEPIVEANSRRVLARLAGYSDPLGGTGGDAAIWGIALALLPHSAAGRWNQALMDLGALVCTPREPLCTRCPLADHCDAHRTVRTAVIPAKTARRATVVRTETALVARRGQRVLLVQRAPGEWWEGLWDFPRLPARSLLRPLGCGRRRTIGRLTYTVTHHRIDLTVAVCQATRLGPRAENRKWVTIADLAAVAMTSPGRRIGRLLAPPGSGAPAALPEAEKRP